MSLSICLREERKWGVVWTKARGGQSHWRNTGKTEMRNRTSQSHTKGLGNRERLDIKNEGGSTQRLGDPKDK